MKSIIEIVKKHRWKVLLIYLYSILSQLMFLVEPYFLGKAIDGLLVKDYFYLLVLSSVFLVETLFIYKRMVYDTKVYVQIYNEVVFDYLKRDQNSESSSKIARTEMANNIINFLENDVQYFLMSVLTIIGCLYFIFSNDWRTGAVVTFCFIPIILIVKIFYKKIAKGTRLGHTHYEEKFSTMNDGDEERIKTFFKRRKKIVVAQSTLQGKHWASLSFSKSIFLVISLVVFTHHKIGMTQGEAVSMYAYIHQFLISILSIPVAVEIFFRMKDVVSRLSDESTVKLAKVEKVIE